MLFYRICFELATIFDILINKYYKSSMLEGQPFDIRRILPDSVQGLPDDHLGAVIDRAFLDIELEILTSASQDPMASSAAIHVKLEALKQKIIRWEEDFGRLNLPRISMNLSLFDPGTGRERPFP